MFLCFRKTDSGPKSGDRKLSNFWYKIGTTLLEDMSGVWSRLQRLSAKLHES
jgi:hypothetical protein